MGQTRVELVTPALSERCSNQLSYCPIMLGFKISLKSPWPSTDQGKKQSTLCVHIHFVFLFLKGGDPAALSSTTTLLRLHPPHEAYLRQRPPYG